MSTSEQIPTMAEHLATSTEITRQVMAAVPDDQRNEPTPCPEYDVARLMDHLVGWATAFADRAEGAAEPTDPGSVSAGDDPAAAYQAQAARMVEGYDDPVEGAVSVGVVLIETIVHGWDLAAATDQPVPSYPVEAVEAALSSGRAMLKPEYRGPDKSFGDEVPVPDSAPTLDRLVGFMGRDPGWRQPA
jgi:uncharacterized protein (TIGR03086 family)